MRLPRVIKVAGVKIPVRYDKTKWASEFDQDNLRITIGTLRCKNKEKFDSFVHEAIEAICWIRHLCYDRSYIESESEISESHYIMSHDELTVMSNDLAQVLSKMIKD